MEIFKQELHVFPMRAYLDATRDAIGADALDELLRPYGITAQSFEDPNAWISVEFAEAFLQDMIARCADPSHFARATRLGMAPKYLGALFPLFAAFGTPLFTFQQHARAATRFNKAGSWRFEGGRPGFARISFQALPGIHERGLLCQARVIQESLVPTLFGRPPGTVAHPRCMIRGDEVCTYEVTWLEPPKRRVALLAMALSSFIGLAFAQFASLSALASTTLCILLAFGGWAFGRWRIAVADLAQRTEQILEHNEALERMTRANEERFAQLIEAKAEVEQRVEQRTRELSDATRRLSQTLSEIQALDRAKTEFFNNVSHELRSPLTLLIAPLEDLVAGRPPPGKLESVFGAMHRNATRLLQLINQLLDLAKVDAGEVKIAVEPIDLPSFARSIVQNFEAAASKKGVQLGLQAPSSMAPVMLDVWWIESAITNLLANALRVTKSGGTVRVIVDDGGGDVSVSVADEGPGIAPADQSRVFERFAQGDSSARMVGTTGIGLALVREALRLHNGDVKLTSTLGQGATFKLSLPRRHDASGNSAKLQELRASRRPPPMLPIDDHGGRPVSSERAGPDPTAPLALVVEDNPELLEFVADVLELRYRVRAVNRGQDAIVLARELRPDVVVSDVAMPEMDGYELCRALRSDIATRAIPVLLVTARTEVANVLEGFESGANDYIVKPFHGRELLARVDVHVRLRRVMQELAQRERHAMLGVLAASVAHQVRNPLTTLMSGLPAMRSRLNGSLSASAIDMFEVMIDCTERIGHLTDDLMDLSRVDRAEAARYRPSDGLRASIRLVGARVSEHVLLEEKVEDAPQIEGRPGDMNHVFLNLLDNAVRAVGARGRIEVDGRVRDGAYEVRISDSGPGVPEKIAQQIFEPFFTTRHAGEGTGLGLSIARQVILQAGGDMRVERAALGGAEFIVRIPVGILSELEGPAANILS